MRIKVTDRRGKYPAREYDVQATDAFLAYAEATERFIQDSGHRIRKAGERASTYYARFWNERVDPTALQAPAGWQEYHTGGGCMAWQREFESGIYCLMTNDEAAMPVEGEPVVLGFYEADGRERALFVTPTVAAALAIVDACEFINEKLVNRKV